MHSLPVHQIEARPFCWDTQCVLEEWQPIIRNGICHYATVTSWNKGDKLIITPIKDINSQILEETERMAEVFANDYLSANPQK